MPLTFNLQSLLRPLLVQNPSSANSLTALCLAAIALMFYGACWPAFGYPAGTGAQRMAMLAACTTFVGGLLMPRRCRVDFTLLWTAFGLSCAIGTIGVFFVGFVYMIAVVLILFAIFATPNNSLIELPYDWRYILAFYVGYIMPFLSFVP